MGLPPNVKLFRQAHAGLVDATDVDANNLFEAFVLLNSIWPYCEQVRVAFVEESFGGHTDSKPRGPAAVGVDVAFEARAARALGLATPWPWSRIPLQHVAKTEQDHSKEHRDA